MKTWQSILLGVGMAVAVLASFYVGRRTAPFSELEPLEPKSDTLVIHDTFTVIAPKIVTRRVIDSVLIAVTDTVMLHDTTYIYLEREQVTWRDSLCEVYASGIYPQVDSVIHFTSDRIITIEKPYKVVEKTRWGVGFQVGVGMGMNGKRVCATPYIGVGVSYNIFCW